MTSKGFKRFKKNKIAVLGTFIFLFMVIVALIGPFFVGSPEHINLTNVTKAPSSGYIFGTDDLGRDQLARAIYGARVSLSVGLVAVTIAIIIGSFYGSISGFFGGIIDEVMMRFVDMMLAIPTIFLILTVQVMLKPSIYNVMIIIGLTSWMGVARMVRGEFLSQKEREYVTAARARGIAQLSIMFKHILPNAKAPIIVAGSLGMAGAILTESVLSFLGLGVQPPHASWGNMLENAQAYMIQAWWMAVIPGILILLAVLSLTFIGEGLRDAFDPKM